MAQRRIAGRMRPAAGKRTDKHGRSDSVRSAWIGALAGSLVAAAVAGGVSLYTVSSQITAEDQRSQTEFLRSKQQEAYAQFITAEADEIRLRSAYVAAYVSTLHSEGNQSAVAAAAAAKNELSQSHDKLTQALGNVVLVGSLDAAAGAQDITDELDRFVHADRDGDGVIENYGSAGGAGGVSSPIEAAISMSKKVDDENRLIEIMRSRFILLARKDLGN